MAYTTLQMGSKGSNVKKLQQELIKGNYLASGEDDGIYGSKTAAAVKAYQTAKGLSVDGIAGNQTLGSLYSSPNTTTNINVTNETPIIKGSTKELQRKAYNNTFNENNYQDVVAQKDKANSLLENYEAIVNQKDIIDQKYKDAIDEEWVVPEEVKQADAFLMGQLEKIQSGKTSYTDQIKELRGQIQNREDFEYDVDKDQLFQQALASAMRSGQTAMQNTIGQASALTGGYGSTYATSAGNQAYNAFIEDAYNNLPEYYQTAMEAYQMEGQEMYQQLAMLNDADATEYGRLVDSFNATSQHRNQLYNEAYTEHQDKKSNAYNAANLQLNEYGMRVDNAYNLYSANFDMYQTMYSQAWNNWDSQVKQAQAEVSALNTDAWNQATYDQTERWNQKELDYKYDSLDEEKRQFNYSIGDTNNDGVVSDEEKAALNQTDYSLPKTDIDYCQKILADGGTIEDVNAYLSGRGLAPSSAEEADILNNAIGYGTDGNSKSGSKTKTNLGTVSTSGGYTSFEKVEGDNFDVTYEGETYRVENRGKVTDSKLKAELDKIDAHDKSVFVYNGDAYVKGTKNYYKVGATNILWGQTSGYSNLLKAMTKSK